MNVNFLKNLAAIATELDAKGFHKEADDVDSVISDWSKKEDDELAEEVRMKEEWNPTFPPEDPIYKEDDRPHLNTEELEALDPTAPHRDVTESFQKVLATLGKMGIAYEKTIDWSLDNRDRAGEGFLEWMNNSLFYNEDALHVMDEDTALSDGALFNGSVSKRVKDMMSLSSDDLDLLIKDLENELQYIANISAEAERGTEIESILEFKEAFPLLVDYIKETKRVAEERPGREETIERNLKDMSTQMGVEEGMLPGPQAIFEEQMKVPGDIGDKDLDDLWNEDY
jgi:hypothetical protein